MNHDATRGTDELNEAKDSCAFNHQSLLDGGGVQVEVRYQRGRGGIVSKTSGPN